MVSSVEMPSPVQSVPRVLRIFAALFAIAAMLCVSAASVSAAHTHVKDPVDQCSVCFTAHMTTAEVAVIHVIHAPEVRSFVSPLVALQSFESRIVSSTLTRGPPASF